MCVDSLRSKHAFPEQLSFEELRAMGAQPKRHSGKTVWVRNPNKGEPLPRITFYSPRSGVMYLLADVSIPRFANGHNARLLLPAEMDAAIRASAEYVEQIPGRDFDCMTASVSRADFAIDIHLGEPAVYEALRQLSRLIIPGLHRQIHGDSTVYFGNKSRELCVYAKLREVLAKKRTREAIDMARGNLRFEYRLLNRYGIDSHVKTLGLPDSTVRSMIRKEVADSIFVKLFGEIDFPNLITNEKTDLQMLKERFRVQRAMFLHGFLEMVHELGELFFKDPQYGFKKGAYYRAARDCRRAGVWRSRSPILE